ncbi:hypothetical protein [Clostridium sp.]|uniref:hypothetical protein n=1 Tax=Clostridium sp. TaxID=1506 RepID=UPI002FCC51AA
MKAKNLYIGILISALVFVTGCTAKNSAIADGNSENTTSQNVEFESGEIKDITELMMKIQSEEGVMGINTSKDNDTVTADITLKNDADSGKAKALADKYAKQIKKIYDAKKANVNVIQNEKNIANVVAK